MSTFHHGRSINLAATNAKTVEIGFLPYTPGVYQSQAGLAIGCTSLRIATETRPIRNSQPIVHLVGMCLIGVNLMGGCPMGVYLTGVNLMGGCQHGRASHRRPSHGAALHRRSPNGRA